MDEERREETGAARSQNVVHVTTRDAAAAARLLAPAIARHESADGEPAALVVTPAAIDSNALARAIAGLTPNAPPRAVPLTSAARARRLLARRPAAVIVSVDLAVILIRQSLLKLSSLGALAILWTDEILRAGALGDLETILADVPRSAERVALTTSITPDLEAFLDRAMWRARRVAHFAEAPPADVPLRFVVTPPERRDDVLRLLLDALDPEVTAVATFSDEGERSARRAAEMLGYTAEDSSLRITRGVPDQPADLIVLYDDPAEADVLRSCAEQSRDLVVFVPAERVSHLRAISGSSTRPLTFSGAFASARSAADALRDEIREVVRAGGHVAQMAALEPLASTLDPVEMAAATVTILLRERQKTRGTAEASDVTSGAASTRDASAREASAQGRAGGATQRFTRVFLSVGERDGVRRGDLVGAIAGEGGISGSQIGKIELRDSHAVVEIESDVAAEVISRMGGTLIRGKRVTAREDRQPEGGGAGAPRGRGDRPPRGAGGRGAPVRGERGGPARTDRAGRARSPRGEGRPPRGRAGETDRPARGRAGEGEIERTPRAARESAEWSERAERLRNARRGPGGPEAEGEV